MTTNVFGLTPEEGTEAHEAEGTPSEKLAAPNATPADKPKDDEQVADPTPAPAAPSAEDPPATETPAAPLTDDQLAGMEEVPDGLSEDGTGFRIGNKNYKTVLDADHAFRQNRGRAQAEAKRANEAAEREAEALRENARLQGELETLRGQTPQTAPAATPTESAAPEQTGLTELLTADEINNLIAEEGADVALIKMQERMEARSNEKLDARTAPLQQQEEVAAAQQTAIGHFNDVSELTDEAGNLVFPELSDDAQATEIVATWDRLVMEDPDFRATALTPMAVKHAYSVWKAGPHAAGTSSQPPASDPAPPQAPGSDAQDAALSGMSDGQRNGSTTPTSSPRPPALPANSEEAVRKLIAAKQNPVFGVEVEQRKA